jgi:hypothetical protein
VIDVVKGQGALDVLVVNAGTSVMGPPTEPDPSSRFSERPAALPGISVPEVSP